jgi:hypothetical protein
MQDHVAIAQGLLTVINLSVVIGIIHLGVSEGV